MFCPKLNLIKELSNLPHFFLLEENVSNIKTSPYLVINGPKQGQGVMKMSFRVKKKNMNLYRKY